jgi:hypothetical protein
MALVVGDAGADHLGLLVGGRPQAGITNLAALQRAMATQLDRILFRV